MFVSLDEVVGIAPQTHMLHNYDQLVHARLSRLSEWTYAIQDLVHKALIAKTVINRGKLIFMEGQRGTETKHNVYHFWSMKWFKRDDNVKCIK